MGNFDGKVSSRRGKAEETIASNIRIPRVGPPFVVAVPELQAADHFACGTWDAAVKYRASARVTSECGIAALCLSFRVCLKLDSGTVLGRSARGSTRSGIDVRITLPACSPLMQQTEKTRIHGSHSHNHQAIVRFQHSLRISEQHRRPAARRHLVHCKRLGSQHASGLRWPRDQEVAWWQRRQKKKVPAPSTSLAICLQSTAVYQQQRHISSRAVCLAEPVESLLSSRIAAAAVAPRQAGRESPTQTAPIESK